VTTVQGLSLTRSPDWVEARQIKTLYIKPGGPWENGHVEGFHNKLRDECLNRELFASLAEARVILESWRTEYNQARPHSSLGYQTPEEFARRASKFGLLPASGFLPFKSAMNPIKNEEKQLAELQS
jgi:putative transposase